MRCPHCQHVNSPDVKFCAECGSRLRLVCAACGASHHPEQNFCDQCMAPLRAATSPERIGSPGTYTPKYLAEKIRAARHTVAGERKQITVLFADLERSMELLAGRDPEEARTVLDPVLERMMEAVHRYEGTVNQVMGDGIMALFGAPLAHEDHAVRACYAALRMQEQIGRDSTEFLRAHGVSLRIRVGLNSGEVVVRSIDSDLHMDYTAIGQTTHLAARMEQLATPGTILATAHTVKLAEGYVRADGVGPIAVKGLRDPVTVYEITGALPARTRLQAASARGLSRFVGREAEMAALSAAIESVRAGRGQVVALVGEPGVGKSRLFWEFVHAYRGRGCLILHASSVSYGKGTAYLPVIDLLKDYFEIRADDDARTIGEKVSTKLLSLDAQLLPLRPALSSLFDVPGGDREWDDLDPPERRHRTLRAVRHLLMRESQVQPLILVFEDLHWIDSETQALLDGLVEIVAPARMLLLLSHRPEYRHGWGGKSSYTQLRIDPLAPATAEALLDALLGTRDELAAVKRLLIRRTDGNPFFLEECVRTLVETKVLVGEPGAYRIEKRVEHAEVPATIQTVLAARIDRLPAAEKQLLQSAAVIGKVVPFALLRAITPHSDEELRRGLTRLQSGEFLYETTLFPDPEYTFKHSLTHEVAYGALLHEQRRLLHARIVAAIEQLSAARLSESVDDLAHHAWKGELWDKAATYFHQAGARAVARSASVEAVASFEKALAALARLPRTPQTLKGAVDVRLDLQGPLVPLGALPRMMDYLQEAEAIATELSDQGRLGRVAAYMAHCLWWMGESGRSVEAGQRALAIASALADINIEVVASIRLGQAYFALADYERSIDACRRTIGILKGELLRQGFGLPAVPAVVSRVFTGRSLAMLGHFTEGLSATEDGVRVAEIIGHQYSIVLAYWGTGDAHLLRGNLGDAVSWLERALGLCEGANFSLMAAVVSRTLGEAYALSGRGDDAVVVLEQAVDRIDAMKFMPTLPLAIAGLSEGYLLAGRLTPARESARRAQELSRVHGQRGTEAYVARILGDIHASGEDTDVDAAEMAYRDALGIATAHGMRPLMAHCHLRLGRLLVHAGGGADAESHLARAVSLFGELGMTRWLPAAEADLSALRVADRDR
jgi:class 3 adenylate cyclase/tetratricopeptide (TPR) repeat protein